MPDGFGIIFPQEFLGYIEGICRGSSFDLAFLASVLICALYLGVWTLGLLFAFS